MDNKYFSPLNIDYAQFPRQITRAVDLINTGEAGVICIYHQTPSSFPFPWNNTNAPDQEEELPPI